jgi:hypothetical protein
VFFPEGPGSGASLLRLKMIDCDAEGVEMGAPLRNGFRRAGRRCVLWRPEPAALTFLPQFMG